MDFYTFNFRDEKMADVSPDKPYNLGPADKCPSCGRPTSLLKWLPPRNILLTKPKFGDFVFGPFDYFLVSQKFVDYYIQSDLTGIESFSETQSVRVKRNPKMLMPPNYYYVSIQQGSALLDAEQSNIKRLGRKQIIKCLECYIVEPPHYEVYGFNLLEDTWDGLDIFLSKGFRSICFTKKFVNFCLQLEFTNFSYVHTNDYVFDVKDIFKK